MCTGAKRVLLVDHASGFDCTIGNGLKAVVAACKATT